VRCISRCHSQNERIFSIKPVNEVHSVNIENSVNSGSDKINANVVRLGVVVGAYDYALYLPRHKWGCCVWL